MRIAIDIDDVLYPWSERAHEAAEAAGITNGRTITQWAFHEDYGCTAEALWAVLFDAYADGMLLGRPYPDAVEQLQRLRDLGHTIHLVTARGFETKGAAEVRANTADWVHVFGIPHDTLTFARDKTVIRADLALDDSLTNCAALRDAGAATWLMTRPHNQSADAIFPRVSTLAEFVDAVDRMCRRWTGDRLEAFTTPGYTASDEQFVRGEE